MKYFSFMIHSEGIHCLERKKLEPMAIPQPTASSFVPAIEQKYKLKKTALKLCSFLW